jgi:hypothetical protein
LAECFASKCYRAARVWSANRARPRFSAQCPVWQSNRDRQNLRIEFDPALLVAITCGAILAHPYALTAAVNAYEVVDMARSAIGVRDHLLRRHGIVTTAVPLLEDRR